MALTGLANAVSSSLYTKQNSLTSTRESLRPDELGGRRRTIRFDHTLATGEGTGTVFGDNDEMNLCIVPAGSVIDLKDSYFKASAELGDGTIFKIGVRAFYKKDGSQQAEDAAYLVTVADAGLLADSISAATLSAYPGNGADNLACVRLNSREPVVLFAKAVANGFTFDGDIGDVWSFQFTYTVD